MALLSDRQQRNLLIALGLTDFATRSKLSTAAFDVIVATARGVGPAAARGAARFVPAAVGTARFVAMRHPYVTAAVVTYEVVKNREQIRQLIGEGWEVIEPAVDPLLELTAPGRQELFESIGARPITERLMKRKPSAFNKAVSQGMRAVKTSTSYGGKGVIKPAKKAFSVVVKLAAAKKKKKKAPKSGLRRRIWNAMKGLR